MIFMLAGLMGLGLAALAIAGWGGIDLLLGMRTLTEDRAAGLLLVCPVLCAVGLVGIVVYEELR